ncbi:hypothetical protein KDH_60240 [Dictyobacter sp. S3.2.2.5]|uniref:DUF4926 domain-containing protein n=1 Tax=Dictyobacter halimunensis TaxID=3026934 RepID=A0ABQ6FZY2_9CHLR|nr:hypothetical protein KDH_60240 [Dictyobacter sp. S3.2.2.5]
MEEFDVVRIVKLLNQKHIIDGDDAIIREPQVGDVGTIVMVYQQGAGYCMECVDDDGWTIWLANFTPEELELIWKSKK